MQPVHPKGDVHWKGVHWKDWRWSWNSSTLAISCEELTHWKRPWWLEGLGTGGKGDDWGWDGWMTPPWWIWVWVNAGSLWWTGRPGILRFTGSQRVGRDWATELNWADMFWFLFPWRLNMLIQFCSDGYYLIYIYFHFAFNLPVLLSFKSASFEKTVASCWHYYFKSKLATVIFLGHLYLIWYDYVGFNSIMVLYAILPFCNVSFYPFLFFSSCWTDFILPRRNYSLYWIRIEISKQ